MNTKALNHSIEYIRSWLSFRYDRVEIPGYSVAISYKGKIIFNESYGYANLENKVELTPQHIFRIASHSKTFTATALMQLQEAGKLRIDDYVVNYLPWLKDHNDKRWQKVTLRQLMSHGAGVIRDGLDSNYWQLGRPFPDEKEFRKEILEAELVIDNNIKHKYSNFGYTMLGLVIQAVSGKPYNKFVMDNIVNKIGLKNTGPEYTDAISNKTVTGYTRRDINKTRLPIDLVDTKAMSAATGFYSTAEDLCTYFSVQMVGSKKLLDDESKKEMQRVQWQAKNGENGGNTEYGLGFEINHIGGSRIFGHGGGFPGQTSVSMANPDNEIVVVALINSIEAPASWIAKGIHQIINYYQNNTPTTKPKHDLSMLEGRYMNIWSINDVIVTGDKIITVYPDVWQPLSEPNDGILSYVDDTTFKISDSSSYGSSGELVKFNLKNGEVETMNDGGTLLWPEKVWMEKIKDKKIISLE